MKNKKQFVLVLKRFLIAESVYSINEHLNYKQEITIHNNCIRKASQILVFF
jgi:hypothetical protein